MPRLTPLPVLLLAASSALAAPPKLTVQLDWVAEPEHGAFYTAEALGYFKQEGLDVTLLQGGPNTYVQAKVATGQVQLGQDDSTNSLLAIQAGAPLVNVAAIFQHDPSVLMMQERNPVSDWKDLEGKTIMARPEWAFLPYLRDKYRLQFKVIPQNFDLGRLAVDPRFIQQGYYIAEPYFLEQKGIHLKFLKCWDSGFDAYTTLITSRKFAQAHGGELRAFLRALQRGWKTYLEGDPGPAHAIMLKINPKVTAGYLDWSRRQIIRANLARDEEGRYLTLAARRFRREISQLEQLKILQPGKVTVEAAMDASFLPQ
ncbi:MAG TPA: ABC transporter substrate-binding protein [Opitutaceae bacterium]|nr:ABC transporter substrate-binding protein [Opitutaceae bacterium]